MPGLPTGATPLASVAGDTALGGPALVLVLIAGAVVLTVLWLLSRNRRPSPLDEVATDPAAVPAQAGQAAVPPGAGSVGPATLDLTADLVATLARLDAARAAGSLSEHDHAVLRAAALEGGAPPAPAG